MSSFNLFESEIFQNPILMFVLVLLASFVFYWQVKRQGLTKVLTAYLVLFSIAILFYVFSEPSDESAKLQALETRLVASEKPSSRNNSEISNSEKGISSIEGSVLFGILVLGIILYRSRPEWLSISKIKSFFTKSTDWIRPQRSTNNELGSSDLATAEQIKRWLKKGQKYDTVLPISDLRGSSGLAVKDGNLIIPNAERNRHVLIVAKTGSGKTTKLILPILYNDCLCPDRSTIIIDSKQEMWHKLSGMTKKYNPNKNVVLFNPLDTIRSLSWNILDKVESDTDCKLIANSVVMATDDPSSKQDSPFFRNSALQILNAIMVGLMNDPNERISMPRIHQLINRGMHYLCDWLEAHAESIRTAKSFVELARSGSQNADTIMSELSMRLQAWDLKAIRSTTFYDEINIEKIIKEPTLFVIELRESELKMLRPLANVIVVELLRYLTKYAEECPGQTLPRPVGLVIDEFASALGRLPDIHIKLNTLRSRNVSIVAAIQSIGQVKGNYGEDWESVLSGFSTKIFMPSLDFMDSEWASKESGVMTIRYRTASKGQNRKITENFASRNVGLNEQLQQRQVLTPGEIGRPPGNQATFFMPETPVFQGHLTPYYKVPDMKSRISEFNDPTREIKLRTGMIVYEEEDVITNEQKNPVELRVGSDGKQIDPWSEDDLWAALNDLKDNQLDWANTTGDARRWWEAFEQENAKRVALVLKVAQEISQRKATITDFFLAYVYSNSDNIQATFAYLDYTIHMKGNSGVMSEPAAVEKKAAA